MSAFDRAIDEVAAASAFSGVVHVSRGDTVEFAKAYGFQHRAYRIPNDSATRFAIASGTKALTAVTLASLVEEGRLQPDAPVRPWLGEDLLLIDAAVTLEQLLAHRSGIGDYLDEDLGLSPTEYVLPVPVHKLETTQDYLRVLESRPMKFRPGGSFSYSNSGYVVLALLAERCTGESFYDLLSARVCEPAGMSETAFLRSDELPAGTAVGYLTVEGPRTNVLHLPVRGSGDGGIYSTAADVSRFWTALFSGDLVSSTTLEMVVRPWSEVPARSLAYGWGFWLRPSDDTVIMEGYDAGVSFRSVHDPATAATHTVISNTTEGAWPLARHLDAALA